MRVTVIDYKAGNLTSVLKALRHLGAETVVTDGDLSLVETAERIVLPGVGHFAATERLDSTGLTSAIRAAIARGVPFLGICVGMQWLYAGSSEAPAQPGLAHFAESVRALFRKHGKSPARRLELARNPSQLAPSCRRRTRRVRLLHALLQSSRHCRHRGHHSLHRALRISRRARQRNGRTISSGKVRRNRAEDSRQFSQLERVMNDDQTHHRLPRCP